MLFIQGVELFAVVMNQNIACWYFHWRSCHMAVYPESNLENIITCINVPMESGLSMIIEMIIFLQILKPSTKPLLQRKKRPRSHIKTHKQN